MCKKLEGRPYEAPRAADLPGFRVRETVAFSRTGVDFAGPTLREGRSWYLDLLRDLSALEFMHCLRRFSARRGTPSLMISDNAKTSKRLPQRV